MPSTTSGGLPFPLSSEPVKDGAQAIANLAWWLEARSYSHRLEHRAVAVTPNAAGGFGIAFARPFTSPPDLVCQCTSARAGFTPVISQQAAGVTAGGFSGLIANAMSGQAVTEQIYISYIAVGPDPAVWP